MKINEATNVGAYYQATFGLEIKDQLLYNCPLDSVVGQSCQDAIERGHAFYEVTADAVGNQHLMSIARIVEHTMEVFLRG
jgi:hypothetical protein